MMADNFFFEYALQVLENEKQRMGVCIMGIQETKLEPGDERVSIDDFGAVGDGITDDSEAFKAAWDEAVKRGLPLWFSIGKSYLIDRPLTFHGPTEE